MSPDDRFANVVELVECGLDYANQYLENDYTLLAVIATSQARKYPEGRQASEFYVSRRIQYVLGRGPDVVHFEPEPRGRQKKRPDESEVSA